jgi:hypothetical protein
MAKPIFNIVLRDCEQWIFEAEWPDGTIEQVETFKAYFDALAWLTTQSDAWLRQRALPRHARGLLGSGAGRRSVGSQERRGVRQGGLGTDADRNRETDYHRATVAHCRTAPAVRVVVDGEGSWWHHIGTTMRRSARRSRCNCQACNPKRIQAPSEAD